ncbi:MAG: tRNA-dihydrouridine synthase family protein [Chloroflexota bacterium]
MTTQFPTFWVRDVPVYGDVILAPMARYSDVPYRAVCYAYGSAMNYTEFTPAEALLGERNEMWRRLDKREGEETLVFQIFGNDARKILYAAQRIEQMGPDIIDINMGCSVAKVSGRGAGVGMMRQPKLVADTFRLLSTHLSVPVTGKIRLGWDHDELNFLEIARIMEDNGASMIAMHGRTKMQKYNFEADWDAIGELKQAVSVPVIGNGDVRLPSDIDAMKAHTGCDAVMVGRAAVGNPWIFSRQLRSSLMMSDIIATVRLHVQEMLAYYGDPDGLRLFPRHLKRYFLGLPVKPLIKQLMAAPNATVFHEILDDAEDFYGDLLKPNALRSYAALTKPA